MVGVPAEMFNDQLQNIAQERYCHEAVRFVSTTNLRAPLFSGISVQTCQLRVNACILNTTILKQRLYYTYRAQIYM